jgi:riboflavin synthase
MFTGLVEDIGVVERVVSLQGGARLIIRPQNLPMDELDPGESLSCSGCCLTMVEKSDRTVLFDVVPETLSRTTIGSWRPGRSINLERALAVGDRFGGHFVQGHVDGVGQVISRIAEGPGMRLGISLPAALLPFIAEKGSVAVDGVSLTVAKIGSDRFEVALIPETLARTTLCRAMVGGTVNLEADLLARHAARLQELAESGGSGLAPEVLLSWGYGKTTGTA